MYLIDKQLGSKVDVLKEESPELKALKVARGLIEEGWVQGRQHVESRFLGVGPTRHSYCMWGALTAAVMNSKQPVDSIQLVSAIGNVINCRIDCNMIGWNDHPGRTKEEVLDAFDRAIEHFK